MRIDSLDPLALTAKNIDATLAFCSRVPCREAFSFGNRHRAPAFGREKIDLQAQGGEYEPGPHRFRVFARPGHQPDRAPESGASPVFPFGEGRRFP